jgi:hypothetical protein
MRGAISRSNRRSNADEEVAENDAHAHVTLDWPGLIHPKEAISFAADFTAPDLSLVFLVLFGAAAYFHEQHFSVTGIAVACWFVVQLASYVIKDDFKNDIFWSILALIGHVALYLIAGYGWALVKLYFEIARGHYAQQFGPCVPFLSPENATVFSGCALKGMLYVRGDMSRWAVTWPMSIANTVTRDPLHFFTDLAFEWSKKRIVWVVASALGSGVKDAAVTSSSPLHTALWAIAGVVGYVAVGYAWTHIKLFIDVWQGALPPSLDRQVRETYEKKLSYWAFVINIKWLVLQWIVTWPVSLLYTLVRHPLRILADFVYQLSQRKYMYIVSRAMEARMLKTKEQ